MFRVSIATVNEAERLEERKITGCENKVPHETAAAARASIAHGRTKRRTGPRKGPIVPYHCRFCNKWHVGQADGGGYRKSHKYTNRRGG